MAAAPASGRRFYVGGNWKCNGTKASVDALVAGLSKLDTEGVDVMVSPGPLHVASVATALSATAILVASQNVSATGTGAFTGEMAPAQLLDAGIKHTIIGHSERRSYFGDSDEVVTKKVANALKEGLNVIACLGETRAERDGGKLEEVVLRQLRAILAGIAADEYPKVVIAYEPVWAIGTGLVCGKEDAQAVHELIRKELKNVSDEVAAKTRIIYGGSVKGANAPELIAMPDIDGFLVGGASLTAEKFAPIIAAAQAQAKK